MAFFKALIPGFILTFVLAGILGKNHERGGWLDVFDANLLGVEFYWSWPLFLVALALAWAVFWMME